MKKNLLCKIATGFLISLASTVLNAQTTDSLTLKPDSANGKDAMIWSIDVATTNHGDVNNKNYGNYSGFAAMEWTFSGNEGTRKSLVEFDLSEIPDNAIITSASLSLFHNEDSSEPHSTLSGTNETILSRITESWDEDTVTWNNAPAVSEENTVEISGTSSITDDKLDIDVTSMIEDMIEFGNNGIMISMKSNEHFRQTNFASSDHPNTELHPELKITYELPETCTTLKPDSAEGKDAMIWSIDVSTTNHGDVNNKNYGNYSGFAAMEWTFSGNSGSRKSLIEFDLNDFENGVTITSAALSLFHNEDSSEPHSTLSGSNETILNRITESWDEDTVTWNNAPAVSEENTVEISGTSSITDDKLDIDITAMVEDMIELGNNGMMISMKSDEHFRQTNFASSNHSNSDLHPELKICYTGVVSSVFNFTNEKETISIYPNPSNGIINLITEEGQQIEIFNSSAQLVYSNTATNDLSTIDLSTETSGLYLVKITSENNTISSSFIIE